MSIESGTRFGPYEIVSRIGAGGMGEVFRGRDTRLDRPVAIKVLPASLAGNEQFRARFEREAHTISQLNHPNICTLYDIGHENDTSYLVMELLDGESLADRLARGPLSLVEVLRYGTQIGAALDRAHRAGIVHRDLKPGNVVITRTGAKLLDFGLAKSSAGAIAVSAVSGEEATQHKPLTQEGTILGTFQYMAPEQLEGAEADARTDIFSFGALLYEMATGHRAFEGKTRTSLIAAIVTSQPPPISSVAPMSPPALDHVVRKCLEKDPDDRWQSAHDISAELSWISEAGSQAGVAAPITMRKRERERLAWLLAGILAVTLAGVSALLLSRQQKASRPFVADIASPRGMRFNAVGDEAGPLVVAPDGTQAVYSVADATGNRLMHRSLLTGETRVMPGTEGGQFPFWSPDSRKIGFFTSAQLKRVDVSGGAPVPVCAVSAARGGSWGADDTIVFTPNTQEPIYRVSASGGKPVVVTKLDTTQHTSHRWPSFLPDGKRFLYLASNHQDPAGSINAVNLGSVEGSASRMILRSISNAVYAEGYLLFDRDLTLYAQKVKSDLSLDGEPVAIAQDALYDGGVWRGGFSVARDGLLTYHSGRASSLSRLAWIDRHGSVTSTVGEKDSYWEVEFSPNQQKAILPIGDPQRDLWIQDLQRNTRTKITLNGQVNGAVWSRDGTSIYVDVLRNGIFSLISKRIGGAELVLDRRKTAYSPRSLSPDGKTLLGDSIGVIERTSLDPPGKPVAMTPVGTTALNPSFSPNGKWFAYSSDENGRAEIFVVSLTQPELKWQVSASGGTIPRWRADGKELFFIDLSSRMTVTAVTENGNDLEFGSPETLFPMTLRPGSRGYDVTTDGQKFLINTLADQESPTVVIVKDWKTRLPR